MTDSDGGRRTIKVTDRHLFEMFHRFLEGLVAGAFGVGVLLLVQATGTPVPSLLWLLVPAGVSPAMTGFVTWRRKRQTEALKRLYDASADDEE